MIQDIKEAEFLIELRSVAQKKAKGSALTPARHWVHLPSGALALELTYSGPFAPDDSTLVHELTVVKRGSHGVVFDTWGRPDLLTGAQQDLQRMIDDAAVA